MIPRDSGCRRSPSRKQQVVSQSRGHRVPFELCHLWSLCHPHPRPQEPLLSCCLCPLAQSCVPCPLPALWLCAHCHQLLQKCLCWSLGVTPSPAGPWSNLPSLPAAPINLLQAGSLTSLGNEFLFSLCCPGLCSACPPGITGLFDCPLPPPCILEDV